MGLHGKLKIQETAVEPALPPSFLLPFLAELDILESFEAILFFQ